jgi:hypothetical protein
MQPGDLRRFRDSLIALGADHVEGGTFMVLRVDPAGERIRGVDILIDGHVDEGLGYFWVEDSSEAVNEAG